MDALTSPAYAAWIIGISLLPFNRHDPSAAIPHDAKTRFLRALQFVGLAEETVSRSRAARAAGIPWGTVASWIHRDTDFKESVSKVLQQTERDLADLETEPLGGSELEDVKRIEQLPEVELARIAAGEVPSRRFMAAAFETVGLEYRWATAYPGWLQMFPRIDKGEEDDRH